MFKHSVSITLSWALMLSSLLVISACGQKGKGSQPSADSSSSSSSIGPSDSFASRLSARKSDAFVLNATMDEVLLFIGSQTIPSDIIREHTTFSYDPTNRFTGLQIRVFPQSEVSNLPPEGAIAMTQEFAFRIDNPWQTTIGSMDIWDNWSDGASGNHVQTTIWTNSNWSGNRLITSSEEVIYYDQSMGPDFVSFSSLTTTTNTFNNVGYVESITSSSDAGAQLNRANDGITMTTYQNSSELIEYFYNANGGIDYFQSTASASGNRTIRDYEYTRVDGNLAILIETETYDITGALTNSSVEVQLYKEAICNKSSLIRNTFLLPQWRECFDLSDWDGV